MITPLFISHCGNYAIVRIAVRRENYTSIYFQTLYIGAEIMDTIKVMFTTWLPSVRLSSRQQFDDKRTALDC